MTWTADSLITSCVRAGSLSRNVTAKWRENSWLSTLISDSVWYVAFSQVEIIILSELMNLYVSADTLHVEYVQVTIYIIGMQETVPSILIIGIL